jgi:hypothetical protein
LSERAVYIELEENRRRFEPGDKIAGVVRLEGGRDDRIERLVVARCWRTRGSAPTTHGGDDEIVLSDGERAGQAPREFPFIFSVPPGPYSYDGELLRVEWFLTARAEFADAGLASAEQIFVVEASRDEREFIIGDATFDGDTSKGPSLFEVTVAAIGVACLVLAGLWLLYPNVAALPGAGAWTFLAGLAALGLSGGLAHRLLRRGQTDDDVELLAPSPSDYQVEPGDRASFVVELQPNFKTSPRGVSAVLKGYEHVLIGDAPSAHADIHRFHESKVPIEPASERALEQGQRSSFRVRFRMPEDAPFSFHCSNAVVGWAIEVHVDVGSWPNWNRDFPLVVRPCVPRD